MATAPLTDRMESTPRRLDGAALVRWARAPHLLLLAACGILFFYGVSAGELYRTETLRAIIARTMLETGNWIVPTLYGEAFVTKPPGMYIAIALLSWPFGAVSEWTARLPSALAATATVMLFFWYLSRSLGRRGGLVAALILPMSLLWLDKAPSAEIDMLQTFWVCASILFFLRALECEEAEPASGAGAAAGHALTSAWRWWLLALLCVAGGFLTKWTAPAFFYATAIPLLCWRRRLHLLLRKRHLVAASLAATLCLGWMAAVVQQLGWTPFWGTVSREALLRLAPGYERPYPWLESLLHPFKLWGIMLPWSALALMALLPGFADLWDERGRRLLQALHCWLWPNILIWSLMSEHTPRHSMPCLPAIAGLAAMAWVAWHAGKLTGPAWYARLLSRWTKTRPNADPGSWPCSVIVAALLLWLVVKAVHVHAVVPQRTAERRTREKAALLASLVPAGNVLHILRIKDEGILFYYGRPVRRLASPKGAPRPAEGAYLLLTAAEWGAFPHEARVVRFMTDAQGDPIVLVQAATPRRKAQRAADPDLRPDAPPLPGVRGPVAGGSRNAVGDDEDQHAVRRRHD